METFMLLIRKEWDDNFKKIIAFFLAFVLIYIAFLIFSCYMNMKSTLSMGVFFFSKDSFLIPYLYLLLLGAIFSSYLAFSPLRNRASTTQFLLLPASAKQKWLSKWVFYIAVFLVGASFVFAFVFYAATEIVNTLDFVKQYAPKGHVPFNFLDFAEILPILFASFFFIQVLFFIGMTHFKKMSFLKSFISIALFVFLFITYIKVLSVYMNDSVALFLSEEYGTFSADGYWIEYKESTSIMIMKRIFWVSLYLLLCAASYFKLKEREI